MKTREPIREAFDVPSMIHSADEIQCFLSYMRILRFKRETAAKISSAFAGGAKGECEKLASESRELVPAMSCSCEKLKYSWLSPSFQ